MTERPTYQVEMTIRASTPEIAQEAAMIAARRADEFLKMKDGPITPQPNTLEGANALAAVDEIEEIKSVYLSNRDIVKDEETDW
jgi:hypothetical protein